MSEGPRGPSMRLLEKLRDNQMLQSAAFLHCKHFLFLIVPLVYYLTVIVSLMPCYGVPRGRLTL